MTPYDQVPSHFLPVRQSKITYIFATYTAQYAHIFRLIRFKNLYSKGNSNNDPLMREWQAYLLALQKELQDLGLSESMKHIVSLFQNSNCIHPATGKPPVSYGDVCHLVATKDWYNQNIIYSRQIIHTMLYGMYRDGMDAWFLTACKAF